MRCPKCKSDLVRTRYFNDQTSYGCNNCFFEWGSNYIRLKNNLSNIPYTGEDFKGVQNSDFFTTKEPEKIVMSEEQFDDLLYKTIPTGITIGDPSFKSIAKMNAKQHGYIVKPIVSEAEELYNNNMNIEWKEDIPEMKKVIQASIYTMVKLYGAVQYLKKNK